MVTLVFENVKVSGIGSRDIYRARVHNGWIVKYRNNMVFVPDSNNDVLTDEWE